MPSTIPYDPSLVLGNIVHKDRIDNLVKISELNAPVDTAEQHLNSLISLKRSTDMTVQEMIDMGITPTEIIAESEQIKADVQKAAVAYGQAKMAAEKAKQSIWAKIFGGATSNIAGVSEEVESPIDYNRSAIKQMPIAADSLQMNIQYFSHDENKQDSSSHASTVASFVSESLHIFGGKKATQAAASAQRQTNAQMSRHSIAGTVVISISCTHKNAQVFAPFILDVDKAVRAFNTLFPDDMIKTNDPASIAMIEAKSDTKADKAFQLLSGATYGSSFVGMVHILNTSSTTSSQSMDSVAASLQETFKVGGWFASGTGSFGVSDSFSNSAKNLLSTQNIQSHCSLVTMGIIPSIKSNQVKVGVQSFADFDPQKEMEALATLQGATASEHDSIADAATKARTGQQMVTLKTDTMKAALSGLAKIDDDSNNIIDTNSMMTAMDDYINRCVKGGDNLGVPINYYLKPITQSMIARAWLAKYYPNKYNQAGSADDSKSSGTTSSSGDTSSGGDTSSSGDSGA